MFDGEEVDVVHSMEELFDILRVMVSDDIFIIGGGTVYKALEPYCDTAYITKIDYAYQADTYFPNLDEKDNWEVAETSEEQTCFSIEYYFITYKNKAPKSLP